MRNCRKNIILGVFFYWICLNSSHAQQQTLPVMPTTNAATPPGTTLPGATLPPALTTAPTTAPVTAPAAGSSPAKYFEYQSYCRTIQPDDASTFSEEDQKKRLALLSKKIEQDHKNSLFISTSIKEFVRFKKYKEAEALFATSKNFLKPEDLVLSESLLATARGMNQKSVSLLENFLIENSQNVKILLRLAELKASLGHYSDAREIYTDLQAKHPQSDYSLKLCELYALDGLAKDAEKFCWTASNRHPQSSLPDVFLGITYREKEDLAGAEKLFETALKKEKSELALLCMGELMQLKKQNKKSYPYLKQVLDINPKSYAAHFGLALGYIQDKDFSTALPHFKSICQIHPGESADFRKALKLISDQKSELWSKYYDGIQRCQR